MIMTNPMAINIVAMISIGALAVALLAALFPVYVDASKKLRGSPFVMLCVGVSIIYGGTKPTKPSFHFDGGIKPGANQSWVTNNTIHIEWQRDESEIFSPPDNAPVYIDYRPIGSTNEWGMLAQTVLNAWSWTGELENATNYNYNVYAYYIPPEPVHTNGVWEYRTITDPERKRGIIPLRATIKADDRTIYPPKEN